MFFARVTSEWDPPSAVWALIAETNRDSKQRPDPFTIYDIHPYREKEDGSAGGGKNGSGFWGRVNMIRSLPTDSAINNTITSLLRPEAP